MIYIYIYIDIDIDIDLDVDMHVNIHKYVYIYIIIPVISNYSTMTIPHTHTLQSPCHGFQSKRQVRVHTNPDGVQHLGALGKMLGEP